MRPEKAAAQIVYAVKNRLTTKEFGAIFDELDSRVSAGEGHTSSWMPNRDRGMAAVSRSMTGRVANMRRLPPKG